MDTPRATRRSTVTEDSDEAACAAFDRCGGQGFNRAPGSLVVRQGPSRGNSTRPVTQCVDVRLQAEPIQRLHKEVGKHAQPSLELAARADQRQTPLGFSLELL